MFSEEYDLPDMLRVMGERAVERLHDRVRLLADGHGAQHIFGLELIERGKYVGPCLLPPAQDFFASGFLRDFEFPISKPVWLLAIAGKKIGEALMRVTGNVLYQGSDGIRFRIERNKEVLFFKLR